MSSGRLPFDDEPDSIESRIDARDRAGRARAVDPRFNVALEASAGTGKTRVLVDRYVNLLRHGVDPANVLAITFTRKAATEMRERIIASLRAVAERGEIPPSRWRELRDRTADISISTIDAFCLSLLREFPLEAGLDPGFSMADDTEVPRLVDESLDRALRICRAVARDDEHVALVFAQLGDRRARSGLAALLNRRIVAPAVLERYLAKGPRDLTVATAARRGATALMGAFDAMRGGLERFLDTGPPAPSFLLLAHQLQRLARAVNDDAIDPAAVQALFARVREHFLTQDGTPRSRLLYGKTQFLSPTDWQAHRDLVVEHGPAVVEAWAAFRRDLNVLVSKGVRRMFAIAEHEYRRTLQNHAVLDFADVLLRALDLLRQMEEFAQSRYRLEARYHHVLVDEFQDTSRAQWELVSLLVQSWGEGAGIAHTGPLQPSIFIVGDRKQSIYGFRDAEVSVLQEAGRYLESLRPDRDVRRSISRSFRSVPALLAFVNDVCDDMPKSAERPDAFGYDEQDRFPLETTLIMAFGEAVGILAADTPEVSARQVAAEIARLIDEATPVRDRDTGVRRAVRAGDVAILFRTRDSHREFEDALERRGIPAYVYKGLGFFDADEIKDVLALLWYLAEPLSDLRAAAWLRSRFVRMSDEGLRRIGPGIAGALSAPEVPRALPALDEHDARILSAARASSAHWRSLQDRMPPGELLDLILNESAYAMELRGVRYFQARENLKKIRALIRRIQNRGYVTLGRIAAHLDRLAVGDESNAVIDAVDAVNLMTLHAAKGLEFPIVFIVNMARGTGSRRDPIRVTGAGEETVSVSVGDFRSESDDDEAAREREETKRLVYVGLTRARDRLYLASVLKEGRLQPARGSLAEVLPASLLETFTEAAAGVDSVRWQSRTGKAHLLHVPRDESAEPAPHEGAPSQSAEIVGRPFTGRLREDSDFAPLEDTSIPRLSVGAVLDDGRSTIDVGTGDDSDRLRGTLVHRLLQLLGVVEDGGPSEGGGHVNDDSLRSMLARLIPPDERLRLDPSLIDDVIAMFRAVCRRQDVRDVYLAGEPLHEVPFTLRDEGRIVRGTIDCLIRAGDVITILEFKTGRRRRSHDEQVSLYRRAAQAIFPETRIDARVIYAQEGAS